VLVDGGAGLRDTDLRLSASESEKEKYGALLRQIDQLLNEHFMDATSAAEKLGLMSSQSMLHFA